MLDAGAPPPIDASSEPVATDAAQSIDAQNAPLPDAAPTIADTGVPETDEDAGTTAPPEPPKPMPLRCGDDFCPLVDEPIKACCTTRADVERHAARAAGSCGVDLRALGAAAYADGCWQRDQLGFIDPRCPNLPAAHGGGEEPGCCADDGLCGTNNSSQHLGCRHAPGSELRACGMEPPPVGCDPSGTYGFRITVDAAWDGRSGGLADLTDAGRGPIDIYYLANIEGVDASTRAVKNTGRVCGITLPPFYSSILCEAYQPVFPRSIWESRRLPTPLLEGHFECGAQGCVLSMGPTTYLFGIRLDNTEAVWPTPQQTASLRCPGQPDEECFVDDDDDGWPGITVRLETDGSIDSSGSNCSGGYDYRAAPLNGSVAAIFDGVRRSDRIELGVRARVGLSVRFGDDCATGMGSAVVQYVNSRATACRAEPGTFDVLSRDRTPAGRNDPCTATEAAFIDQSMPSYTLLAAGESPSASSSRRNTEPSAGPVVSIVRFGPSEMSLDCEQVRDADYE